MMNSDATLNRIMTTLVNDMDSISSRVNDLLVHRGTFVEHLETLRELLSHMQDASLKARPSKCLIGTTDVDVIGHFVKDGTIGRHELAYQTEI